MLIANLPRIIYESENAAGQPQRISEYAFHIMH